MINIDFNILNPLEKEIHSKLSAESLKVDTLRITRAAELCECSVSKISKFTKKLGFTKYKQYLDFLYERELPGNRQSSELSRIENFIKSFDQKKVDDMVELINKHEKIILFGYGPSLACAQYFEYRLRTCTNKVIFAVPDDLSITSMTDKDSLLLFFTVTGTFRSFKKIYHETKTKGSEVAIIAEEYNTTLFSQCDKIFCLAKESQPKHLKTYEKSRTTFFIFMEEVIIQLTEQQKRDSG